MHSSLVEAHALHVCRYSEVRSLHVALTQAAQQQVFACMQTWNTEQSVVAAMYVGRVRTFDYGTWQIDNLDSLNCVLSRHWPAPWC